MPLMLKRDCPAAVNPRINERHTTRSFLVKPDRVRIFASKSGLFCMGNDDLGSCGWVKTAANYGDISTF
jgi:hypothetical protein